jgi:peptidyl-prolyl cis-trans isomerase C
MKRARNLSRLGTVAALASFTLIASACSKGEKAAAGGAEGSTPAAATPTPAGTVPATTTGESPAGAPAGAAAKEAMLDPAQIPAVVARLDGAEITKQDLLSRAGEARSALAQRGAGNVAPTKDFFKRVLDDIVGNRLLYRDLSKQGKAATPAEIDQRLAAIRGQFSSDEDFEKSLAARGFDRERLKREIAESLTVTRWITESVVPSITIDEAELKKFYDANLEKMVEPERARARHILVKVEQNASADERAAKRKAIEALRAKIAGGADFAAVARESSDDKQSGAQGGDLGWFFKGQMAPAFDKAAFELALARVSEPVETRFGFHLIEVHERQPAKKIEFEAAKPRIEQVAKQRRLEEAVRARINELAGKSKIEILL